MKKKTLLIVSTSFNYYDKRFESKQYDVLTISISHQYFLKSKNINYTTLENYYDDEFEDMLYESFNKSLSNWLFEADKIIRQDAKLDHTYSGNGFWFAHRFSELLYIQNLIDKLSNYYQEFEFIIDSNINRMSEHYKTTHPSFIDIFGDQKLRLEKLIYNALPNKKLKYVKPELRSFKITSLFFNYSWLKNGIKRRVNQFLLKIYKKFYKKNKHFLTLQDGYDLEVLNNKFKDFKFINIKNDIISNLNITKKQNLFFNDSKLNEISTSFFKKYFPNFSELLFNLIKDYNFNIISQLNQLNQITENIFNKNKIDGLILPMCAQDIYDFYIVKLANKKNIPVYFMKHNGVIEIFKSKDFLKEYLHENKYLKRVQFVHSEIEYGEMKQIDNIDTRIIRSIRIDELSAKQKNSNKRLLLAFGSPSHYTLKDLGSTTFDTEKINFLNKIINLCERYHYELNIKLHPRGSIQILNLLQQIKRKNIFASNIKIITHEKIESIFYKYDTILVDTTFSLVVSNAIYTNKNIIVYCPRKKCLNTDLYSLIIKRINFIHKLDELDNVFEKLDNNSLKYESNDDFNNKIQRNLTFATAIQKFRKTLSSN